VPRCSLRARGGSSPCSPCSARNRACAWLRVAPVPAPSGAALALRCAPRRPGRRRDEGRPDASTPRGPAGPAPNKGLGKKEARWRPLPAHPGHSMARKRARSAVQGPQRISRPPTTSQETDSPQNVGCVCGPVTGRHSAAAIARLPRGMGLGAAVAPCNALRNALKWA
jgi:hypothetical protein